MSLLPFLAVAVAGAVLAVALRGRRLSGTLVGLAAVAAALLPSSSSCRATRCSSPAGRSR